MRNRRRLTVIAIIVGIPVIALAWWLGSPLLFDKTVDEDFPMSSQAIVPEDMTREEVEAEMSDAAEAPDTKAEQAMPEGEPEQVASGFFNGADSFHEGSGRATIYELDDGTRVLRLEAFEVTNGPDLHVLLVPDPRPESRDDVAGYVDLGSLKGNVGDQNYEIPANIDPAGFGSVVIYCEPFHVIFATATIN